MKSDITSLKLNPSEIWQRNLIFLSISQFIAMMGMNACVPFLPLYVRELGVVGESSQRFWSGLVFSGPYFLSIVFVPIWGSLGDKYGRKLMIIRAILGLAISMFLMGFARNVFELFLLRVFQGATSGFIAANLGFTVSNTPVDRKGYAVGFLQSSQSAGAIAGPILGGFVSDLVGFREVFFAVAFLCLLSALLIFLFVKEVNRTNVDNNESMIQVFKLVITQPKYRYPMVMITLGQIGIFLTFPILPYFLEQLGAPTKILSSITGIVIGVSSIFNIIFAPIWGRWSDKFSAVNLVKRSSLILSFTFLLHSFVSSYLLVLFLRVLVGLSVAGLIPILYSHLGKIGEMEKLGAIMGFASSATLFGSLIAFLGSALISPVIKLHWLFVLSSGILLITFILSNKIEQDSVR